MTALAQARAVTKRFGSLTVVDGVDLDIEPGEVVGLLGANGAGKTTLIRILLGLLRPSAGAVTLFGARPSRSTRRRLGYVPQSLGLYLDLTVAENRAFSAAAFDVDPSGEDDAVARWRDQLAGSLPLGALRRVAFALARLHDPSLYVLDEPTSGVGPLGAAQLWQEVRECAERGAGVLVTTHNMDEAEQCDRLIVMVEGVVAATGTSSDIVGSRRVTTVTGPDWQRSYVALHAAGVRSQVHGATLRVSADPGAVADVVARQALDVHLGDAPASLEEAFIELVTRPGRS